MVDLILSLLLMAAAVAGCAAVAVLVAMAFLLAWSGADKLAERISGKLE